LLYLIFISRGCADLFQERSIPRKGLVQLPLPIEHSPKF
jgi:hypothetical protein